ncbi:Alpha/Beta hydrolase protein [Immersiella caudata]|uniref:Alpha/Beta hydrolase protein n=1 Tax=Immersiella caudata TaxID=314043 RepID=A0AA39WZ04_9PEZI|nr:Alpha/Beta hydrolase protein [Immersiella caudata]
MPAAPVTVDEILQTGNMDPDFEAAWKSRGCPSGDMPTDVLTLKAIVAGSLSGLQKKLGTSRPANFTEAEHTITLTSGFSSRILVCHTTPDAHPNPVPVIVLFHGGAHVLGYPEFDIPLARELAAVHNAAVICPSTRKAPEDPFPSMIDDAWALLQLVARDALAEPASRVLLPHHADAKAGFLVGGTSSGANFADVAVHLARNANLSPPVTGQSLFCGAFIDPERVPASYQPRYLSMEQNKDTPVANHKFMQAFRDAINLDRESPLWAPFDQHDAEGIAAGHMGMPPTYFQVCGMDMNRDDGLIYERVLREECAVPTKLDVYSGFPHCWWDPGGIEEKDGGYDQGCRLAARPCLID